MIDRNLILNELNTFLKVEDFKDICANGMQVEGKRSIKKVVSGVTASLELFKKAHERNADLIIVHHGLFLKNSSTTVSDILRLRLKFLLENNINLFCYHLPLDAHDEIGNNILLAKSIDLNNFEKFGFYQNQSIGYIGTLEKEKKVDDIYKKFELEVFSKERKQFTLYPSGKRKFKKIAIVSGAGTSFLQEAFERECELFITGEVKESTLHQVKEYQMNFLALGHYNSEILGIKELGNYISEKFNIEHEFISLKNEI